MQYLLTEKEYNKLKRQEDHISDITMQNIMLAAKAYINEYGCKVDGYCDDCPYVGMRFNYIIGESNPKCIAGNYIEVSK